MKIDAEQLRKDLEDYYGAAMFNGSPMVIMELSQIENASEQELIEIAEKNRKDIKEYYM